MKKMILSALLAIFAAQVGNVALAQDDDIYFSRKNDKKNAYKETESDVWETHANDDWDLDSYNRRGNATEVASTESGYAAADTIIYDSTRVAVSGLYYYDAEKGSLSHVQVNEVSTDDLMDDLEAYYFTNRIHRFHNRLFGFYSYNPYYDIAYYDPFYWDYCFYDPWWYTTPGFGYHWGSWYYGWNYGYYTGWYGGWYSPYYHCHPHYYQPHYYAWGSGHHHHIDHSIRGGARRNNTGGHFVSRGDRNIGSRATSRLGSSTRSGNRASLPSADNQRQRSNMRVSDVDLATRNGSSAGGRATGGRATGTTTSRSTSTISRGSQPGRVNSTVSSGTVSRDQRTATTSSRVYDNSAARRQSQSASSRQESARTSSQRGTVSTSPSRSYSGSTSSTPSRSSSVATPSRSSSSSSSYSSPSRSSSSSSFSGGGFSGGGSRGGGGSSSSGGGSRGGGGRR